jgi:hypothetical protein
MSTMSDSSSKINIYYLKTLIRFYSMLLSHSNLKQSLSHSNLKPKTLNPSRPRNRGTVLLSTLDEEMSFDPNSLPNPNNQNPLTPPKDLDVDHVEIFFTSIAAQQESRFPSENERIYFKSNLLDEIRNRYCWKRG